MSMTKSFFLHAAIAKTWRIAMPNQFVRSMDICTPCMSVSRSRDGFKAQVRECGVLKHLGLFGTAVEAAVAVARYVQDGTCAAATRAAASSQYRNIAYRQKTTSKPGTPPPSASANGGALWS